MTTQAEVQKGYTFSFKIENKGEKIMSFDGLDMDPRLIFKILRHIFKWIEYRVKIEAQIAMYNKDQPANEG